MKRLPPVRTHPGREASGFTLVEVVLATAIAAMLFTGAFWTMHQAVEARNELSNLSTPYVMGPAILDVIAGDLANVYFYDLKDNNCFWGNNAEIYGREADAMSFVTLSRTYAPEKYGTDDERHSFANEVAYVIRTGSPGTPFLELWRREDFFVDDAVHTGGDFVMLYDKVHSMSIKYIARNAQTESQGPGGSHEKSDEEMLQDDWNSVKERGVPRAVQITLSVWAKEGEQAVDTAVEAGTARIYTFQRYLTLPQVHMSSSSEQKIAGWDGKYNEGSRNRAANKNPQQGQPQPGQPGQPGTTTTTTTFGGAKGAAGARNRGRNQQNPANAANNPFLQALQNRSGGSRPASGGNIANIFQGMGR